jgi:phosphatidylserine decarboxylase
VIDCCIAAGRWESTCFVAGVADNPRLVWNPERNAAALWRRGLIETLRVLPRSALSRLAGRFAGLRLPAALQRREIELFARAVGVDRGEVGQPLESFASLQEFFTRPMPPGLRPVDRTPRSFVAPCDGLWGMAGEIVDGRLGQVKGRTYSAAALLGDAGLAAELEGGTYATFYLAPHNYHRFHTPCAVRIETVDHIPGTLWPVNRAGLEGIVNLFARNERLVARARIAEPPDRGPSLCMVAVGAVMVGAVRVSFDDLATNVRLEPGARRRRRYAPPVSLQKGAEWGWFELGSSLVLLAPPGVLRLDIRPPGTPLRLGEKIGELAFD